ncbi:hypothetical protein GIB67_033942 [Kingdonia uniflora]|uniref:Angio-associated migratory cell protein n=1 Tax=Kingdonia uniflora TaxID=39325 RepID=A0A7J7LXM5_9MAGN|nr:hypothetical protein GIB67_033942 [Kingdonia uniflora]
MNQGDDEGVVYMNEEDILDEYYIDSEQDLPDVNDDGSTSQDQLPEIMTIACSPTPADATLVATGGTDHKVFLWSMGPANWCKELLGALSAHLKVLEIILRWHPSERILLAGSEDGIAWMWDADNNAYLNTFLGHEESVTCGDFTPDGKTVCTGSEDGSLRYGNGTQKVYMLKE